MAMYFGSQYSTPLMRYSSSKPLNPGARGVAVAVFTLIIGIAAAMLKPLVRDSCSAPVDTVTVWGPAAAVALIVS